MGVPLRNHYVLCHRDFETTTDLRFDSVYALRQFLRERQWRGSVESAESRLTEHLVGTRPPR